MSHYRVSHRTEYTYGSPVIDGFTMAHLLPRSTSSQQVVTAELLIDPPPDELGETVDQFGNRVVRFAVHHLHDRLTIEAISGVVHTPRVYDGEHPTWESVAETIATAPGEIALEVAPFVADSPLAAVVPELAELTDPVFTPGRSIIDVVIDLCHTINRDFRFDAGFSDVTTPVAAVLAARRGVCQDFAHVAVAALRSKGLAARYVSGYIETQPPPGQPKLVGVDASHAWASAWFPGFGWLEFDPTNDQIPPRNHVTVGWGRDYGDVAPVRGVVISNGGSQELRVAVDVTRVDPAA
ncbi:MAG: transglutaminase family protein [Ilumatobacteraceae bacterium]